MYARENTFDKTYPRFLLNYLFIFKLQYNPFA